MTAAYNQLNQESSGLDAPSPARGDEGEPAKRTNVWGNSVQVIVITFSGVVSTLVSMLGDGAVWGILLSLAAGAYMWWGALNTTYMAVKKKKSPSQEMGNAIFGSVVILAFYSSLWLLPVLAVRQWLVPVNPISCLSFGSLMGWFIYLWSVSRDRSGEGGCFTWIVTRVLRDPPALIAGYLLDQGMNSCFGTPPWPYFHDGSGGFVSVINGSICMGGRPLAQHVPLLQQHEVHSVINMTCELAGPQSAYNAAGIVQLRLPTLDNTAPSVEDLRRGVAFARTRLNECCGGRVYVHCKGGRGRAAVMVLCCLIAMESLEPEAAFAVMKKQRPVVEKVILTYGCVHAFATKSIN